MEQSEIEGASQLDLAFKHYCSEVPVVALDVECVGGYRRSLPARVSVVDQFGGTLLDTYIRVDKPIESYRTQWSGIKPSHLHRAPPLCAVLHDLKKILTGSIVVGHALENDLKYLGIKIDNQYDTQLVSEYTGIFHHKPSLKKLVSIYFGEKIQENAHNSLVDAYYTMALFKRTMVNKKYNHVENFVVVDKWACNCETHVKMPKISYEHKTNLFYRLQNVVNGLMDEKEQLSFFLAEKKKNTVAWRKFIVKEKQKYQNGRTSLSGDKIRIFAFMRSILE